ncbi:MAG: hypothetical protein E7388_03540 [Ruminococcaceae bacterium]|nr:hypothetical protein [Oscillospiraceae bacterium]
MVSRFERFSFAISEIYRYWHKIAADEMEKHGLKGPYSVYFTTMYRYPDGLTSAQLAEICSRDKSDVSRAIALMEKRALVVKEGASYRALLKLTEEGKKVAEFINERAGHAVDLGGKGLSEENRALFYETLELIVSNLQTISQEGLPK